MNTVNGIIVFFALVAEGALTRLAFTGTCMLKRKIRQKSFSAVTDVFIAVIGAGVMLLTCLLLAENVRVFYAVFYLGGIALCHLLLPRKLREKEKAADELTTGGRAKKRQSPPALNAGASANAKALPAPDSALRADGAEKARRSFRMFFGKSDADEKHENAEEKRPFFPFLKRKKASGTNSGDKNAE